MRILLAIDGSPSSEAAVDEVCRRPWPEGSEVRLITVRSPIELMLLQEASHLPMAHDEIFEHPDWESVKFLDEAAAKLERYAPGLKVTPVLLEGRAKDVILEEAEKWGADLIVLGSNGFGIIRHVFLGSVSLAVAMNATCSVEIVRCGAMTGVPAEGRAS
jgi:nucleotide-binding universal stress UspA family protein